MIHINSNSGTKLFSIVIPVHNEEDVLPATYSRITSMRQVFDRLGLRVEIVFVNDGSRDSSADILEDLAHRNAKVRVVHLARNFGHQAAVSAGLDFARGDVVAVMDADLQDPPEQLPLLLAEWQRGYQVIYAVRTKRKETPFKLVGYWIFYRIYRAISDLEMPLDSGDFCVLDRSAVDLLNHLPERQRFVRGLRTWIGLKQIGVPYERHARQAGQPSYTLRSLVKLATDGLVSFSTVPLRLVTRLGLVCILGAVMVSLWVIGATVASILGIGETPPQGWASLACLMLFLSAIQLLSLGVIGEYMTRIFLEVKGRPTYLVGRVVEQNQAKGADNFPSDTVDAGNTLDRARSD